MELLKKKKIGSLSLENNWHYRGENHWDWEAFISDHGTGKLSDIKHVEYILHPTFPEPIRRVSERTGGFKLQTSGWGTFLLKAFVHLKNGDTVKLEHLLRLDREPSEGATGS